ncbi:hypothetical protein DM860_000155 [Cuscuta australis]|uniref:Uncharacterized protein n=1 Tax=Cuscuta australis TaxID=267555 RepID=A0A328CYR1_9ASTE|nr:hypothetical protein DM860_000155 [Cuscuta australis]
MAAPPPMGANMLDASVASPSSPAKRFPKRKKGYNAKRLQAIEKKLVALNRSLNPIPFKPTMFFNFNKHEKLLKHLGLWDFVHIEFGQNIRADLIVQLVAGYDPRLRCSYVNGFRIGVNRADLGRALELHVKKEKGNDLDAEPFSDESIEFIENFVLNWVLLHEDTWIMPDEVVRCMRLIKNKHPEKVDWPGLFWFMVEKELWCWEKLEDCYYASHLQCLIRSQCEALLLVEQPDKAQNKEGFLNEAEKAQPVRESLSEEPQKAPLLKDNVFANEPEKLQSKDGMFTDEDNNVERDNKQDEEEHDVKEGQEEGVMFKEPNLELTLGPAMEDVEVIASVEHVEEEHRLFGKHYSKKVENEKEIKEKEKEGVDDDFAFMHNVEIVVGEIHQATNIPFRFGANRDVKALKAKFKVPERVLKRKSSEGEGQEKHQKKAPLPLASPIKTSSHPPPPKKNAPPSPSPNQDREVLLVKTANGSTNRSQWECRKRTVEDLPWCSEGRFTEKTAEGTPQQSPAKGGDEMAERASSSREHIFNSLHSYEPTRAVLNNRAKEVEEEEEIKTLDHKLREVEIVLHPERSESEEWAIFQGERRIKSLQAQLEEAKHAAKAAEDTAAQVTQAAETAALIAEGKLIIAANNARRAEDRAQAAEARAQKAEENSQRVVEHLHKVLKDLEARLRAGRCCQGGCSASEVQ